MLLSNWKQISGSFSNTLSLKIIRPTRTKQTVQLPTLLIQHLLYCCWKIKFLMGIFLTRLQRRILYVEKENICDPDYHLTELLFTINCYKSCFLGLHRKCWLYWCWPLPKNMLWPMNNEQVWPMSHSSKLPFTWGWLSLLFISTTRILQLVQWGNGPLHWIFLQEDLTVGQSCHSHS